MSLSGIAKEHCWTVRGIEVGQKIGDYEIMGKLVAGGLGIVYEARHVISRRAEAMKVLLPSQMGTAEMVERFRREVQLLATLNHPNIASLHNAFYYQEQLVMVMELVHGETLRDRSHRIVMPLATVLNYVSQILAALSFASGRGGASGHQAVERDDHRPGGVAANSRISRGSRGSPTEVDDAIR